MVLLVADSAIGSVAYSFFGSVSVAKLSVEGMGVVVVKRVVSRLASGLGVGRNIVNSIREAANAASEIARRTIFLAGRSLLKIEDCFCGIDFSVVFNLSIRVISAGFSAGAGSSIDRELLYSSKAAITSTLSFR